MKFILSVFLILPISSCAHEAMTTLEPKSMLPRKAKNIVDLGNKWITFDLNVEGKTRCFIYHKSYEGFADISFGFESISELANCER